MRQGELHEKKFIFSCICKKLNGVKTQATLNFCIVQINYAIFRLKLHEGKSIGKLTGENWKKFEDSFFFVSDNYIFRPRFPFRKERVAGVEFGINLEITEVQCSNSFIMLSDIVRDRIYTSTVQGIIFWTFREFLNLPQAKRKCETQASFRYFYRRKNVLISSG